MSGTNSSRGLETGPRKLSCSPTKPCTVVRRRQPLTRGCPADDAGGTREQRRESLGGHLPTGQTTGRSVGGTVAPDGK